MNACHTHQQHTSAPVFLYFVIIDRFWSIQKFQNVIDNLFSIFRDQRDPSFVRPMNVLGRSFDFLDRCCLTLCPKNIQ